MRTKTEKYWDKYRSPENRERIRKGWTKQVIQFLSQNLQLNKNKDEQY